MPAVGKSVGRRVGKRVGISLGRSGGASGPVQLLDFDGAGATFARNSGTPGTGGGAQYRTSASSYSDALSDVLRVETLGGVARYLFEGIGVNLATRSDELNTGWGPVSTTVDADVGDAPDGNATADRLNFGASANARISKTIAAVANDDVVTLSAWVRGESGGETVRLQIVGKDAAATASSDVALTTTWQKIALTVDVGTGAPSAIFRGINGSDGSARAVRCSRVGVMVGAFPQSVPIVPSTSVVTRYPDSLVFATDEVPLALREGVWTVNVRPLWATADLVEGERFVICSTDSNNYVAFEKGAGSALYLRAYAAGSPVFGCDADTARDGDYPIIVDYAGGVMTFDGVAGSTGASASLPGGSPLRWGGTAGGSDELFGGTSEPWSVS